MYIFMSIIPIKPLALQRLKGRLMQILNFPLSKTMGQPADYVTTDRTTYLVL